ncbi:glutamate receptor 3-like [Babylonia areolata]|uniref:glutamate receptor 3-like n=1 Tax=Babylonia areolata TaxID=304850 RepID=UPI003FD3148C
MAVAQNWALMALSSLLFLAASFRCVVTGSYMDIPVGAILDSRDLVAQKAFDYGMMRHRQNVRRKPYFRFNVTKDTVDVSDTFQVASAICRQMSRGVFAILGQKDTATADIVHSFTSIFHMPFLTPSPVPPRLHHLHQPTYQLHLRPERTPAVVDMIRYFGWRQVHYLYDSDEGLQRLQQMFRALGNDSNIRFFVNRFSDVRNVHEELRAVDAVVSGLPFKSIVLDLSSGEAYRHVLRQIPEVGMNKKGYSYLLTTLDFKRLNLSRYRHGGVNVTGFQLLDKRQRSVQDLRRDLLSARGVRGYRKLRERDVHPLPVTAALILDALSLMEKGISGMLAEDPDVFRWIFRRRVVYNYNRTRGIPCTTRPPIPWMHGANILGKIKGKPDRGLSGRLTFVDHGSRKDYTLHVYSMALDRGPKKIGTWSGQAGFASVHEEEEEEGGNTRRKLSRPVLNTTKVITSIISEPFLMYRKSKEGVPLVGNDKYEGYAVDLANGVSGELGFEYRFKLVEDSNYGRRFEQNNTWNGMIGELMAKVTDMAIASLTITAERERYVDFSKPFMEVGVTIIIKKPQHQTPGVFSFMEPLSIEVWLCITVAYVGVSVALFVVSRFSPAEWHKDPQSATGYENEFSFFNSLWFSMGALMFQGSDSCPRSVSGRIIGGAWWFFVLIIISSYTANLAAFLTMKRMIKPIESVDDLVKHPTIKYGVPSSGATLQFFKTSEVPVYRQMYDYMSNHPDDLTSTSDEGIQRVRDSKGKYAFMTDSSAIEYANNREPCDTTTAGPKLNNKGFGIATPRGSQLRDQITLAVLRLKEGGVLHTLQQRWWIEKGQCGAADIGGGGNSKIKTPLTLSNVAGIFYILISGLVFAILLGVFEFRFFRNRNGKSNGWGEADMRESQTHTQSSLVQTPCSGEGAKLPFDGNDTLSRVATEYTYDAPPRLIGFESFMHDDQPCYSNQ